MSYKEFVKWCGDRSCDGCWGMRQALDCIQILEFIRRKPFWRREWVWKEFFRDDVMRLIVIPINNKIDEVRTW